MRTSQILMIDLLCSNMSPNEADTGIHTCLESWPGACLFIRAVCTGWRGWSGEGFRERGKGGGKNNYVPMMYLKELFIKRFCGTRKYKRSCLVPGDKTWHRMGAK